MQNSEEGIRDLQQLLQAEGVESAVRVGDMYSMIIEYNANNKRWKQAYAVLQEMRSSIPEQTIKFYVNPKLLMAIHRELNIDYNPASTSKRAEEPASSKQSFNNQQDYDDDIRDNVGYGTYDD